jgi:hypothetical protein
MSDSQKRENGARRRQNASRALRAIGSRDCKSCKSRSIYSKLIGRKCLLALIALMAGKRPNLTSLASFFKVFLPIFGVAFIDTLKRRVPDPQIFPLIAEVSGQRASRIHALCDIVWTSRCSLCTQPLTLFDPVQSMASNSPLYSICWPSQFGPTFKRTQAQNVRDSLRLAPLTRLRDAFLGGCIRLKPGTQQPLNGGC